MIIYFLGLGWDVFTRLRGKLEKYMKLVLHFVGRNTYIINSSLSRRVYAQSSTLYIYYIYIEHACTQSPSKTCHTKVLRRYTKYKQTNQILAIFAYFLRTSLQILKQCEVTSRCMQRLVTSKSTVFPWSSDPFCIVS